MMAEEKNILYIGGFELPDRNAAAHRVIANGKILKCLGYSVIYISVDKSLDNKVPIEDTLMEFEGFEYFRVKYPTNIIEWLYTICSIKDVTSIMRTIPNLKFIFAYNYPSIALGRLKGICKTQQISLIADCSEWYQPRGIIRKLNNYIRMRIIHPKLDGMIAISTFLYNYYKKRMANVIEIPPLVDSDNSKWVNPLRINEKQLILVYAGSSGNKDRIDLILPALANIKNKLGVSFLFRIIGLSKKQYIQEYGDDYLNELGSHIVFEGRLSHLKSLDVIKTADFAVFIRDINLVSTAGFPTKFVEALSCGTPVLTNSYSNVENYLLNDRNGYLLNVSSNEALTKSLELAMTKSKEHILDMKRFIRNENFFDYRRYIMPFDKFLKQAAL